jgi:SpoIID/LytB domain protein
MSQYGAQEMAKAGYNANAILAFYYPGTSIQNQTVGNIRVQLRQAASVVVRYAGADGAVTPAGSSASAVAKGGAVTLTVSGSNVVASGAGATKTAKQINLTWSGASNCSGYVTVDGASAGSSGYCRGSMSATVVSGQVNLIVTVGLGREYIYGLGEVPSSWEPAALQAQAAAGRTYAAKQTYKSSCDCEVYSDTRSQAYAGRSKEIESGGWGARWVANVNLTAPSATVGSLILYGGAPITASYSAANGGSTEASNEIWSGSLPYLVAKADPWSVKPGVPDSIKAWTVAKTQAQVAAIFGLPDVTSITITTRTAGGSAKAITAKASNGTSKVINGAETIRNAFGLKSAHFSITGSAPPPVTPPPDPGRRPTVVKTPFPSIMLSPDLTGDGLGEVLGLDQNGTLVAYPFVQPGVDRLDTNYSLATGLQGQTAYAAGDWDRDSLGDVMTIDSAGRLYLRRGLPGAKLAEPRQVGYGWINYRIAMVGDITSDGWPDLLAIDPGGLLWTYEGTGTGFKPGRIRSGSGWTPQLRLAAGGDANGDGRQDILMIDAAGRLYFYAGNGQAGFAARRQVGSGWSNYYLASGFDLNGDKRPDLIGRNNATGLLYYYQGTGSVVWSGPKRIGSGW